MGRKDNRIRALEGALEHSREQIQALRQREAALRAGVEEMRLMVDAVLVQTARTYGQAGVLRLPQLDAEKLLAECGLKAGQDEETGEYVLTVCKRK